MAPPRIDGGHRRRGARSRPRAPRRRRSGRPRREGGPPTEFRPGVVLLDLRTGKQTEFLTPAELAVTAYPVFAGGHFWVNNWSPNAYVEIDPGTGTVLKQITPPARDPNVHGDFATVTPFTVQGNTLWVTSGDDLVKMDIALGQEVDRFKLDDIGPGSGLAEGVAVGGGSVWLSRDVGRGQILRLNPVTGSVEHVWNDLTPYLNLAYSDGSLWMADERGIARIDGLTNALSVVNGIQNNCGGGNGGCVVAGGGFGWTDDGSKGATYKVDRAGHIAATYPTGIGSAFLSYRDDVLWVANPDDGTVTGIDALTGRIKTRYAFGHPVAELVGGDGVLLVRVEAGRPLEARIDSLTGTVAKFFAHWNELGADEPARPARHRRHRRGAGLSRRDGLAHLRAPGGRRHLVHHADQTIARLLGAAGPAVLLPRAGRHPIRGRRPAPGRARGRRLHRVRGSVLRCVLPRRWVRHPQAKSELPRTSPPRPGRHRHQGGRRRERRAGPRPEPRVGRHHQHGSPGTRSGRTSRSCMGGRKRRGGRRRSTVLPHTG